MNMGSADPGSTSPLQNMPVASGHPPMPPHQMPNQRSEKMGLALEFLDRVKMYYHDQPDVYNQFLDIMKEFKNHR